MSRHYLTAALLVATALALRLVFDPILGKRSPFLFFPLAILLTARFGGWLPGLVATLLSTLAGWYFLMTPRLTWLFETREEAEFLVLFFMSSIFMSLLGSHLRTTLIAKTESEAALRALLDCATQGILAIDTTAKIVMANRMAETMFGFASREILGQPLDRLIPEDIRSKHRSYHSSCFREPRSRPMGYGTSLKALHKSGTTFPVEIALSFINTATGALAIAFITDITERRRVDEERLKFVSLAERSPEFIGMCDLNLKPFYVNPAGMRLVGLDSLEETRETKVQDFFFPEDQAFIVEEFFPRVLREGCSRIEIRFRHFRTGGAISMLFNVFGIYDVSGAIVGWGTVSSDIGDQKRAERVIRESQQKLRALAGRLINAEEEARRRISRELHDDIGQKLAVATFECGNLLLTPSLSVEEIRQEVSNVEARVAQISNDVRQIAHQLHPAILEDLGITAALREACDEFSAREHIEATFQEENIPKDLPMPVSSCLYRITQEALHNVSKHAHAHRVFVRLTGTVEGVYLSIRDTGVGFDTQSESSRLGLGFVSMKERVELVHGKFSVQSQPGHGAEVTVFVPLEEVGRRARA